MDTRVKPAHDGCGLAKWGSQTNPVILQIKPVTLQTRPVILQTNPVILRSEASRRMGEKHKKGDPKAAF